MRTPLKTKSSPRNPREPMAASARQALLKSAANLFAQKGLDGVTVREIADHADVNLCLISYYFKGKEGLYHACIEEYGKNRLDLAQDLMTPVKTKTEFQERLKLIIDQLLDSHAQNAAVSLMISREIERGLPNARLAFENTFLKFMQSFMRFMQDAQKKKILCPEIDPRAITLVIHSTIVQFLKAEPIIKKYFGLSIHSEKNRRDLSQNLLKIFTTGILENHK